MSGKKKIYEALLEGATQGLADSALYEHVVKTCDKASSKKIVRASLLALTDPDVRDAQILQVIYALAIKHRLDPISALDLEDDQDAQKTKKSLKSKSKKAKEVPPAVIV